MTNLTYALDRLTAVQPFGVSWYLKDLATGREWGHDPERLVATRSTRKVAIMMTLLSAVARGEHSLEQPIVVPHEYQGTHSGITQFLFAGPTLRLHDAMVLMIAVSDNGCTGAIVDLLGLDRINAWCRSVGMARTVHRMGLPLQTADLPANTVSTAREQAYLLEAVLLGSRDENAARRLDCQPVHCAMALRALRGQQLRGKIPALLPEIAKVAHKDGTGPGMHHDTGIVFQGDIPLYLLCAYTFDVPERMATGEPGRAAASRFIAALSRSAWDTLVETSTSTSSLPETS
ncbi:serine hydrolase [Bradyrhizobium erythrophlei]|uniref:beta-lactamase n=1 Tax=Bradyrhizobium erythrophlei TaxID=1437360 RepID=A0A1M5JWT7_9BRAD|nr:serine hydrolase [Bradyrhizobium erythrophlei]SHG45057.1 beta-lactamase class A [Bradyrhizobium erythrophlei]